MGLYLYSTAVSSSQRSTVLTPLLSLARDCAITHNGTALVCCPGQGDRTQDCLSVRSVLKRELGLTVAELPTPSARLSGSDVLFTGREFFVGLGPGTNTEGALAVASTWPEYPCTPVKVSKQDQNTCWKTTGKYPPNN